MREYSIPIKITIPFPCDRPDKNDNIYTKEAVNDALTHLHKNIPIVYRDNKDGGKDVVLGHSTGTCHTVVWDSDSQTFRVTIDGVIYAGGTSCIVHDMDTQEKKITKFQITGLGLSVLGSDEEVKNELPYI